jgi:signal transduction histidine kinase
VELAPPVLESEELGNAFTWLAEVMAERYQLQVEVEVEHPCPLRDDNKRRLLFSVARELLFNVTKHAGVKKARLEARADGDVVIVSVVDNGIGFDVDAALHSTGTNFGLFSVRERISLFGGHFEIDSAPGAGTRVTVIMPQ